MLLHFIISLVVNVDFLQVDCSFSLLSRHYFYCVSYPQQNNIYYLKQILESSDLHFSLIIARESTNVLIFLKFASWVIRHVNDTG